MGRQFRKICDELFSDFMGHSCTDSARMAILRTSVCTVLQQHVTHEPPSILVGSRRLGRANERTNVVGNFHGFLWQFSLCSPHSTFTLKNIVDIQLPFQKQGVLRVSREKKRNTENSLIFNYFESPRIRWPSALRSRTSILFFGPCPSEK